MDEILAINFFKNGNNCAQSVFAHFANRLGLTQDSAVKIATGFGAGMGRTQQTCGAITGGILVLNSRYGRTETTTEEEQEELIEKIQILCDVFKNEHQSTQCLKILNGCNLRTEKGQNLFKNKNMINICYGCVQTVVGHLENVLSE